MKTYFQIFWGGTTNYNYRGGTDFFNSTYLHRIADCNREKWLIYYKIWTCNISSNSRVIPEARSATLEKNRLKEPLDILFPSIMNLRQMISNPQFRGKCGNVAVRPHSRSGVRPSQAATRHVTVISSITMKPISRARK